MQDRLAAPTPRQPRLARATATLRRTAALLITAAPLCLSSCATTQPATLLSKDAVVLDLPLAHQDEMYECGLIAVSVLCQYYGTQIPEPQRKELAVMAKEHEGLSGGELREELEKLGFEVFLFEGTLDRAETGLYSHVDAGRPLIVMTTPGGKNRHYLLFLGYDEPNDSVCLLDPVRGKVLEQRPVFERSWERCKRFTLLALPKEKPETLDKEIQR